MKRITPNENDGGPAFDLSVENELLILKLKAEFGTECTKGAQEIPPEVVHEFLLSVYQFESKFREPIPVISVYDKIGRPAFRKSDNIPDQHITEELNRVNDVLAKNYIVLDVLDHYPDRQIYKFLTEEFLYHRMDDIEMDGYTHHFCYEDFHPNYQAEIDLCAKEFLVQWFARQLGGHSSQLADCFIHPDSREFSKDVVLTKIRNIFDAYVQFSNCNYHIDEVSIEWDDEKQDGKAHAAGTVSFDAETEDGGFARQNGPFELYLSNTGGWWNIYYFVFPGFIW